MLLIFTSSVVRRGSGIAGSVEASLFRLQSLSPPPPPERSFSHIVLIGMFQHYESEQEKKRRELEAKMPKQEQTGPVRSRGRSRGNNFVFLA